MQNTTQTKRPREDDVLECYLYPRFCYTLNPDEVTEDMLQKEIDSFNKDVEAHIKDHLWHRDSLTFTPRTKQALQFESVVEGSSRATDFELLPHIHVLLRFDEDIGDEWFVVSHIINLTKKYEGLIARMVDSDGEFLLIEAADELPVWATPETCHNRVFILNGAIHAVQDKQKIYGLNILNCVYQRSHIFKMSEKVQAAIQKRISIYSEENKRRNHKARAYLPDKAAYILKREPSLVSAAIRQVCHSDPLERKVCRAMRYFPPEQRVMANVKMTKCLYAMAVHCRYTGDPRTGWNLPPANSPKYNAYLLGIKIACGLEMLMARANEERRKKAAKEEKSSGAAFNEEAWTAFMKRLESTGYFRDLLEGSDERQLLTEKATDYYKTHVAPSEIEKRCEGGEAQRLLEVYRDIQSNDVEMEAQEVCKLSPEDSDSWLNVDPTQLEKMLEQQFGIPAGKPSDQPSSIQDKVQAFINQKSGVEGVQFHGENEDDQKVDMEDNGRIDFDPDVFDTALRDILDLVVPGDDGEFDGSSEGSLGGDDEDRGGEMDKYMKLMDSELQHQMVGRNNVSDSNNMEENLMGSIIEEAGGSGPLGNILGGPVERLKHLNLKSSEKMEKN